MELRNKSTHELTHDKAAIKQRIHGFESQIRNMNDKIEQFPSSRKESQVQITSHQSKLKKLRHELSQIETELLTRCE